MVNIQKSGDSAIKFTFTDNDRYLYDGEITVPLNSLILVLDESDMVVIKKVDGDVFLTFLIDNTNFSSKAELEEWFKENACGSTGGGGGVTSGEVQTMIDESISGKADTSDVQEIASDVSTVSGDVNTLSGQVETDEKVTANALVDLDNRKLDASAYTPTDLSNYYTKSQTNTQINNATSGLVETSAYTAYTAATDARLSEDEEVTSAALNELNDALDDKADTTAVTASIAAAVSGKQDTLVSGTNIKTINSESLLGSGNIDIQGGGKTIVAGRGIAVATGETADTVSFNLPISAGTGEDSLVIASNTYELTSRATARGAVAFGGTGYHPTYATGVDSFAHGGDTYAQGIMSHAEGQGTKAIGNYSHAEGVATSAMTQGSHAEGWSTKTTNMYEHASGQFNNSVSGSSTFGDSGNTLFSVGNGTAHNARHNAFEIRQNGDIYCSDGTNDVKLQDTITATTANTTALGGLKLVSLTQAQYDALATKDASTLYIITNNS